MLEMCKKTYNNSYMSYYEDYCFFGDFGYMKSSYNSDLSFDMFYKKNKIGHFGIYIKNDNKKMRICSTSYSEDNIHFQSYAIAVSKILLLFLYCHKEEYQDYIIHATASKKCLFDILVAEHMKFKVQSETNDKIDYSTSISDILKNIEVFNDNDNFTLYSCHNKILNDIGDNEELIEIHNQEILDTEDYFSSIFNYGAVVKIERIDVGGRNDQAKYFIERQSDLFEILETLDLKNGADIYFKKYQNGQNELIYRVHGQNYEYQDKCYSVEYLVSYRKLKQKDLNDFEKFDEFENFNMYDENYFCTKKYYLSKSQFKVDSKYCKKIVESF